VTRDLGDLFVIRRYDHPSDDGRLQACGDAVCHKRMPGQRAKVLPRQ
jgi:hypothetical protein